MKFLKLIVFVFCLQLFFGADTKAAQFNYNNGWFDNFTNYKITNTGNSKNVNNIFDNNINSFAVVRGVGSGVSYLSDKVIVTIVDPEPVDIIGYFIRHMGWQQKVDFYEVGNPTPIHSYSNRFTGTIGSTYRTVQLLGKKIDKIVLYNTNGGVNIYEFDFFINMPVKTIGSLELTSAFDNISAKYTIPKPAYAAKLYLNDELVATTSNLSYKFDNLKADTDYKVSVSTLTNVNGELVESALITDVVKTASVPELPDGLIYMTDIGSDSAKININKNYFSGVLPDKLIFYIADKKTNDINIKDTSALLKNLKAQTDYDLYYLADYKNGNLSKKKSIKFTTLDVDRDVSNLTATSTASEVSLKWSMPQYKTLDFARIYRKKDDAGFLSMVFAKDSTKDSTYEPLFETNGTTFKDLTVAADKDYNYKITTVSTSDDESDGKTIVVKTKKITVDGGGTDIDDNGDYVITWTSPITGKIKVMVGGKQYAIVPASDKKITIPKKDMSFNILGNPDVKLTPIDDDGNEGDTTTPGAGSGTGNGGGIGDIVGGGSLAALLTPNNILQASMGLIAVVASILLLRLAFMVAPRLIRLIRNALNGGKSNVNYVNKRRADG